MFNVCIVGAGSIGALKSNEFDSPTSKNILTHAHAVYKLRSYGHVKDFYIVDFNAQAILEANKKWKCTDVAENISNLSLKTKDIDIFVIACYTDYHKDIIMDILKEFQPKLLIIEKPFGNNMEDAVNIYLNCKNKGIPIVVNYIRRFCPRIQTLKEELDREKYGKIKNCNILYVRGLERDGCHAIDLCNYFFGSYKNGKILGNKWNAIDDYSKEDLTYPVWMEYEKCKNIYMGPVDGRDYSIFEMDIITENARINIIDHSREIRIFTKEPEKIYGKFYSLNYEVNETINNDIENALYFLHANCIGYLSSRKKHEYNLFCTGKDGLKVRQIIQDLLYGGQYDERPTKIIQ